MGSVVDFLQVERAVMRHREQIIRFAFDTWPTDGVADIALEPGADGIRILWGVGTMEGLPHLPGPTISVFELREMFPDITEG